MSGKQSVPSQPIVSHDRIKDVMFRLLRTAVIVERRFTVEQLADESGVPVASIRSYMKGTLAERREPSLSYALSIASVLGKRAVNSLLAVIGYSGVPLDEPEQAGPALAAVNALDAVSRFARCAIDNTIDHVEQPISTAAADQAIAELLPYSSQADAA